MKQRGPKKLGGGTSMNYSRQGEFSRVNNPEDDMDEESSDDDNVSRLNLLQGVTPGPGNYVGQYTKSSFS